MGKKILVVDDDAGIRDSFVDAIAETSYELVTADAGDTGVEEVKKTHFDLIFLDLKMPRMDGVTALRKIRELDPNVPVYIITGFYSEFMLELQELSRHRIRFDLLEKPFTMDQVLTVIQHVLEKSISSS